MLSWFFVLMVAHRVLWSHVHEYQRVLIWQFANEAVIFDAFNRKISRGKKIFQVIRFGLCSSFVGFLFPKKKNAPRSKRREHAFRHGPARPLVGSMEGLAPKSRKMLLKHVVVFCFKSGSFGSIDRFKLCLLVDKMKLI